MLPSCFGSSTRFCSPTTAAVPKRHMHDRPGTSLHPHLTKSSNLLKATIAPIRWLRGEKPLSMKSSVLCRARSGLEMLTGMDILQGGGRVPMFCMEHTI